MLTRQALDSGAYLEKFRSLPNLWTSERIEASLAETLKQRPACVNNDVWIFAYGSLMWNPMVDFDRREVATLHEWHRSFCLSMTIGRGSPERPGRMLALEAGGHTTGLALRLTPHTMHEDLKAVWNSRDGARLLSSDVGVGHTRMRHPHSRHRLRREYGRRAVQDRFMHQRRRAPDCRCDRANRQ